MSIALCYHAISERWPADLSVTPEIFSRQLSLLHRRGYHGVTFSELVRARGRGKLVSITFDDGFRSVYELARPVLKQFGWPGTLFVVTSQVGSEAPMSWPGIDQWLGGEHESELVPSGWDELAELQAEGWEIGSHTHRHPHLTRLGADEQLAELRRSRDEIERRLDMRCTSLAYPYGDHDEGVCDSAEAAGYVAAGTLPRRFDTTTPLAWPRAGIYNRDGIRRFRMKVNPILSRLRGSHLWPRRD